MALALSIGFCGIDERPIFMKVGKSLVPNQDYAEISLAFSNGEIARHGICRFCAQDLTEKKLVALLERIKESWKQSMVGWASEKQFAKLELLTLKAFDSDEKKTIEKYQEVKRIEFKKHLEESKKQKEIAEKIKDKDLIS